MSAPLAGKFSDHYEVLGVDAKADLAAIKAAYTKLAAKYSPTNPNTGNKEKFQELNSSYEVLSDPALRKAFDSVRGGNEEAPVTFPVAEFLGALDADAGRRLCLLSLLYYRRKAFSISPGITQRQVEGVMHVDAEQLAFIIWVLKQKGLAIADDKSRLLITIDGIEYIEGLKPKAEQIVPWLKAEAVVGDVETKSEAEASSPVAEVATAPTDEAEELKPQPVTQGLGTAGLSSLRSALQKSIGLSFEPKGDAGKKNQPAKAPAEPKKQLAGK